MAYRTPNYNPKQINRRVPLMTFASDVKEGKCFVNFGAPATLDADGIWDGVSIGATTVTFTSADFKAATFDGSSTSLVPYSLGQIDAPYGRALTAVGATGSENHVVTVYGRDYLGQAMRETFTLSSTTQQVGYKAFKWVDYVSVAAGGAASKTMDIGWSDKLGLPYKTFALESATEGDDETDDEEHVASIVGASLAIADAATTTIVAPFDGFIKSWEGVYTTAMTTAASVITLFNNAVAKTAGDGVAPIGAIGLKFGTNIPEANWVSVVQGDSITLVSDGAGTAGVAYLTANFVRSRCKLWPADLTTVSATTDDPRGLYQVANACNGSREYNATIRVDETNLHGLAHYNG